MKNGMLDKENFLYNLVGFHINCIRSIMHKKAVEESFESESKENYGPGENSNPRKEERFQMRNKHMQLALDCCDENRKHLQVLRSAVSANDELKEYKGDVKMIYNNCIREKNCLETSKLAKKLINNLEENFEEINNKRKNKPKKETDQCYT